MKARSIVLAVEPGTSGFPRREADLAMELAHHVWCHDWHGVERTLALFRLDVSELTARLWQEIH